jgi:hypothetical protein
MKSHLSCSGIEKRGGGVRCPLSWLVIRPGEGGKGAAHASLHLLDPGFTYPVPFCSYIRLHSWPAAFGNGRFKKYRELGTAHPLHTLGKK